jgi:hypothetical protein
MSETKITTSSLANQRRARRHLAGGFVCAECRKGSLGLGRNLAVQALDLNRDSPDRVGPAGTGARG